MRVEQSDREKRQGSVLLRTDVDHFMSKCREFIAEAEFVDAVFFSGLLDLFVLFLGDLMQDFTGWTLQFEIDIVIAARDHLIA